MKRLLFALFLIPAICWAANIGQPPVIRDKDVREYLKKIADNLHIFEVTDTAPNGNRTGSKGEGIIYNNSGTLELWVNYDGATTWQKI